MSKSNVFGISRRSNSNLKCKLWNYGARFAWTLEHLILLYQHNESIGSHPAPMRGKNNGKNTPPKSVPSTLDHLIRCQILSIAPSREYPFVHSTVDVVGFPPPYVLLCGKCVNYGDRAKLINSLELCAKYIHLFMFSRKYLWDVWGPIDFQ